ncbi:MAG: T9SS type A sorting domain-containing protein [Cytophagaceae bacterium]|nr:MAG: T9SS type A sorting domain-containing protein [Cytophagaceae bacterium]
MTFAGINNNSQCGTDGYSDFTSGTAAVLTPGQSYNLAVTVGNGGNEIIGAYLDLNQNSVFEESELIYVGTTEGGTVSIDITIPADAAPGTTRMRVRNFYNFFEDDPTTFYTDFGDGACEDISGLGDLGAIGYGETEDYTVIVSSGVDCAGTPTVAAATSSVTTICAGASFTVSASATPLADGYSFQLQSSVDGGQTWTNVGAAQASGTFTVASQSVATSYRVTVTCTASSESVSSAPVAVGQNAAAECYCTPTDTNSLNCEDGDIMTNVTIGTINNNSDCGTNGYTDYTATIDALELNAGQTYSLSATVGPSGDGWLYESVGVWIDYNQDGTFSADEFTYIGTGLDQVVSGDIAIPETALEGNTRMRVLVSATTAEAFDATYACSPLSPENNFGEIEDYLVNITNDLATGEFKAGLVGLYPNPAQSIVNIGLSSDVTLKSAEIFNMTGQKVAGKQFQTAADANMDVAELAAGVYIIKITTDQGTTSQRLIKK